MRWSRVRHPRVMPGVDAPIAAVVGPSSSSTPASRRASLRLTAPESTQVMRLPREPAEGEFLSRFRQAGGHRSLVAIDLEAGFLWPPPHFTRHDRPRTIAVAFEDAEAAAATGRRLLTWDGSSRASPGRGPPTSGGAERLRALPARGGRYGRCLHAAHSPQPFSKGTPVLGPTQPL